jgi:glycosyltransferase involved in cell wall biosynthesis/peptidoglycan/xylan/chitin deacetylase (PgdA/CDA1 family)
MRLALITSRYWPESSPGAKRAFALAESLRSAGHCVTVLTQMPNYPDPAAFEYERRGRTTQVESDPAGNTTWRFVPRVASKDDLVRRLAWEARFAVLAASARKSLTNLDGVIASVPFVFNLVAARTLRVPMWLDLRDLTWEYARAVGKSPIQRVGAGALRSIARFGFRAAHGVSTTSSAQRRYLIDQGIPAARIHFVPNGVPRSLLEDLARRNAVPASTTDGFVRVVYAGLLGYPQGLGFAVDALEDMTSSVEFHLYGDGVDRPALAERCRVGGLRNVTVHGQVPHEGYLDAIASADVLLASLRPEAESAMPSKILEYMAAGKPVLFAGTGEGADVVREAGAGLVASYGDRRGFQERLRELAHDAAARRQMGENGRRWVEQHRVRERVNESWVRAIENAIEGSLCTRGPMRPVRRLASAAAQGADRSGLMGLLERIRGGRPDRLAVLTYHRIAEPDSRPRPAPGTLSATPSEFAAQMEFLAGNYRVIGMGDLLDLIRKDRTIPPRSVLLTFDDAYLDFEEHAWPVLRRNGLPVTLFVPTGFPDQPARVFWWDRLFQAFAGATTDRVETPLGRFDWSSYGDRLRSFRRVRERVKRMPHREAMMLVDRICDSLGDSHATPGVLGWEALRTLAREGVTLGSHTRSHPMMDRIAPEDAREEIVGSIEDLKREIGPVAPVPPVLAYPAGRFDGRVARVVAESSVELAFTTEPGINEVRRSDRLRLRRVHVGARTGRAGLRAQLLGLRQAQ